MPQRIGLAAPPNRCLQRGGDDCRRRGAFATMRNSAVRSITWREPNEQHFEAKRGGLLRAVLAIHVIIENGQETSRIVGLKPHIRENIVVAAPVSLDGKIMRLAVSLHRTDDGTYHYNFTFDGAAGGPGIGTRLAGDREAADSSEGTASAFNLCEYGRNNKSATALAFEAGC